jgi:DNA-binding response OmpR family regulator
MRQRPICGQVRRAETRFPFESGEDKIRGLGSGADDYMTKPFHKTELVARTGW